MAGVTVAAVAKKVVAAVASNKKGRKFLGYVIGITLFILCIPIIVVYCLFGAMAGNSSDHFDPQAAAAGAIAGIVDRVTKENIQTIEEVFIEYGIPTGDIHKAQMMAITYLRDEETGPEYYQKLVKCFTETTREKTVYDLVEEGFGVTITAEDRDKLDGMYGVTPARKTDSGGGR